MYCLKYKIITIDGVPLCTICEFKRVKIKNISNCPCFTMNALKLIVTTVSYWIIQMIVITALICYPVNQLRYEFKTIGSIMHGVVYRQSRYMPVLHRIIFLFYKHYCSGKLDLFSKPHVTRLPTILNTVFAEPPLIC